MPIRVQNDLPAKEILERENIFVMDEHRAVHQDIRPLKIGLLNLMPLKEDTELQLLRSFSNTPLQVDVTFVMVSNHQSKNTSANHLNKFYVRFQDVKDQKFDGYIISGAPIEHMPFEEVDYWDEMKEIMEWTKTNVTSTIHLCWGAQAAYYYHFGIDKYPLDKKLFGVFRHRVMNRRIPLVRGFDDVFYAPHSRHTQVDPEQIISIAKTFGGVEHRIERVRELDGVTWYNDSIATSPTRTIAGLDSFGQKIIIIAGGYDKKIPYEPLAPKIIEKVKVLVLMGATGPKIEAAVRACEGFEGSGLIIEHADNMEEAVAKARSLAVPGDIVSLSPASASFDLYKNFEQRGHHFKKIVNSLE